MEDITREEMNAHFETIGEQFKHIRYEVQEVRKTGEQTRKISEDTLKEARKTNGRLNDHEHKHELASAREEGQGMIMTSSWKVILALFAIIGAIGTLASIYTVIAKG
jgi:hypothetical protein